MTVLHHQLQDELAGSFRSRCFKMILVEQSEPYEGQSSNTEDTLRIVKIRGHPCH